MGVNGIIFEGFVFFVCFFFTIFLEGGMVLSITGSKLLELLSDESYLELAMGLELKLQLSWLMVFVMCRVVGVVNGSAASAALTLFEDFACFLPFASLAILVSGTFFFSL